MNTPDLKYLCDERLIALWNGLDLDVSIMSERVAEDENERALFGDGPCRSMVRRQELQHTKKLLDDVRKEWYRRYPVTYTPTTPDDEIPF